MSDGRKRNHKVLLADREPFIRDMLKIKLRSKEFDVIAVDNGKDMVRTAGRELPDLIVTELDFTDIDAYRAIQILKGGARTKDIPILVLAKNESPEKKFMLGPYAAKVISKPFSPREVLGAVRSLVSARDTIK